MNILLKLPQNLISGNVKRINFLPDVSNSSLQVEVELEDGILNKVSFDYFKNNKTLKELCNEMNSAISNILEIYKGIVKSRTSVLIIEIKEDLKISSKLQNL